MIGTLEKVMDDMRNGVTDYTKDGECSGCGQCCSNYLPLSVKECFRIREYVRRKHIAESALHIPGPTDLQSLRVMEKNGGHVVEEDAMYQYVRIPKPKK